jgi:hypothetical protein
MKSFEPRSMMQEHLRLNQASQRGGKRGTAGQHQRIRFLNYFEKIVAPSFEGRHSKPARLYCNIDKKAFNSFNAGR